MHALNLQCYLQLTQFLMKNLLLITMLFVFVNGFSQNKGAITGNVSDVELNNEPLFFASVQIKNSSKIAQTNFHGNFEFKDIESGEYTLVFSFLGYDTIEVPVLVKNNEVTQINGALKSKKLEYDAILIADVVMTEKPQSNKSK